MVSTTLEVQAKTKESVTAFNECVKHITDVTKKDITNFKTMAKPADDTVAFFDGLMTVLANKKKTGWDKTKTVMGEATFLASVMALAEYEKLPSSQIAKIKAFAAKMDIDRLKKISNALGNMGLFIVKLAALMELDETQRS